MSAHPGAGGLSESAESAEASNAQSDGEQQSGVDARGSQGVQINQGGVNFQVNMPTPESADVERPATADEFRADVLALLGKLDEAACRSHLPAYLPVGADVTRMARTVRLLGRVRCSAPWEEAELSSHESGVGPGEGVIRERIYALPAERDDRGGELPQPWEQVAPAHERLVVLADLVWASRGSCAPRPTDWPRPRAPPWIVPCRQSMGWSFQFLSAPMC